MAELQRRLAATKLIVFDFDGVIADSEVLSLSTLRDTLAQFGVSMSAQEVRSRFLGASLRSISTCAQDHLARHGRDPFDAADFAQAWQSTLFAAFRQGLQPVSGVIPLLSQLQSSGLSVCIASSSTHERLSVALDAMDLNNRFDHVFSAQDVARGKPAPDLFLHASAEMRTAPEACLVIEDSPLGIQGAAAAGMESVGFVGGSHLGGCQDAHARVLQNAGAGWIIPSHDLLRDQLITL